jgi:hypothetical protein
VREAIRSGIRMNLFQASQQASTTAFWDFDSLSVKSALKAAVCR